MKGFLPPAALLFAAVLARAKGEPRKLIGVAYGTHPRQVLDFYQAKSDRPTPVVRGYRGDALRYWLPGREPLLWPGDSASEAEKQAWRDCCAEYWRTLRERPASL
jgi:hypothetical protein